MKKKLSYIIVSHNNIIFRLIRKGNSQPTKEWPVLNTQRSIGPITNYNIYKQCVVDKKNCFFFHSFTRSLHTPVRQIQNEYFCVLSGCQRRTISGNPYCGIQNQHEDHFNQPMQGLFNSTRIRKESKALNLRTRPPNRCRPPDQSQKSHTTAAIEYCTGHSCGLMGA